MLLVGIVCIIGNLILVGMGSIILDITKIENNFVIGSGSLVTLNKKLESGYLYMDCPYNKLED